MVVARFWPAPLQRVGEQPAEAQAPLADASAALPDLMRQTRHKSTQVALAYLRPADLWRNNVTEHVFAAKKENKS